MTANTITKQEYIQTMNLVIDIIKKYKKQNDDLKVQLLTAKDNGNIDNLKNQIDQLNQYINKLEENISVLRKENIDNIGKQKENEGQFLGKCVDYNKKNSDIEKIIGLNNYQIKKLMDKMKYTNNLGQKKILSTEIGKIYFDNELKSLNEFGLINKKCTHLSNMIGGEHSNEIKIGKYLGKLNNGEKNKKNNVYIEKLNHYIKNMTGGGLSQIDIYDDNSKSYISDIVNGKYKLISDLNLIKKIIDKSNVKDCLNTQIVDIDADDDTGFRRYDYNLKIGCFQSIIGMTKEKMISENIYLFKKYFNTLFTDVYVQDYLDSNTYSLITNYLYFTMTSAFKQYIEIYNQNNKNVDKLNEDDIILMYKGGNTIRFYLNYLQKKIKFGTSPKAELGRQAFKNIQQSMNKGDWDYYVYIDYKRLLPILGKQKMDIIRTHVEQITSYILYKIKGQLYDFLNASFVKNNLGIALRAKLWGSGTEEHIKKFIEKFNESASTEKKINNISIESSATFDHLIKKDSVEPLDDRSILDKKSFNLVPTGKKENINGSDKSSTMYMEVFNFFVNNKLGEFLPSKSIESPVYIQFNGNMRIVHNYVNVIISLFRLKLNNKLSLNINGSSKTVNIPIELIDVSISHTEDNKIYFTELFNVDGVSKKMQDLTLVLKDENKLIASIPSADYMFYDINIIIIKEILFMWQEKKYDKRILRSLLLSLVCMIQRKINFSTLLTQYNRFIDAMKNINSFGDLDDKYRYVVAQFNPQVSILDKNKSYERQNIEITANNFNFYIDTIFGKHVQHIIITKYIMDQKKGIDVSKFKYKDYCDYLLAIHKNIETNAAIYGVNSYTAVTPYSEIYKNIETIYSENFDLFEKNIIKIVDVIATILTGITDSKIQSVDLLFNDVTDLF